MSEYHTVDVEGCNYTMSVLTSQPSNRITSWTHTKGEKDFYDMEWETDSTGYDVENKDRRYKWVEGKPDFNKPQFINTYRDVMFNPDKIVKQLKRAQETNRRPLYTAGYMDGVIVYNLDKLPLDKVLTPQEKGGWMRLTWVADSTVENKKKTLQWRTYLPKPDDNNKYGKIVRK